MNSEPSRPSIIEMHGVRKIYGRGTTAVAALSGVDFEVRHGEFVAILGRSGSGKSTLMNILAGLDRPDAGTLVVDGLDLMSLSPIAMAHYRATKIGIVFQSFHLLPGRRAREQVELPLALDGVPRDERARRADDALKAVGLTGREDHTPAELSGGEQQRVAVARALVRRPPILLCDEPTGNLDSANAAQVVDLLAGLRHDLGCTIVMITHEPEVAARASRAIRLADGNVSNGLAADSASAQR